MSGSDGAWAASATGSVGSGSLGGGSFGARIFFGSRSEKGISEQIGGEREAKGMEGHDAKLNPKLVFKADDLRVAHACFQGAHASAHLVGIRAASSVLEVNVGPPDMFPTIWGADFVAEKAAR